jgi:hypothetical protein
MVPTLRLADEKLAIAAAFVPLRSFSLRRKAL